MRTSFKLCILFLLASAAPAGASSAAICRVPMYEGVCCSQYTSDYDFGNGICCGGMPYPNTNLCPGRDSTPPGVINVSSSIANKAYKAGYAIPIIVTFSEKVDVAGVPKLALNAGAGSAASYVSGSGSDNLTFSYTVQPGDTSADLDYAATTSFSLNGGTIRDAYQNDAVMALPAPGAAGSLSANKDIVVDTTPPVTQDDSDSNWHNDGIKVNLTCSDDTSGCFKIEYCKYPVSGPECTSYTNGNVISLACPQNSDCEYKIKYRSTDNAGNVENFTIPAHNINIDRTIPGITSLFSSPDPFSPNGDGVKDFSRLWYNTSDTGGPHYVNVTIYDNSTGAIMFFGAPNAIRRTAAESRGLGLNYSVWNGIKESGMAAEDGTYFYVVSVSDRAGNSNESLGYVTVDDSPPNIVQPSGLLPHTERGDVVNFSAFVFDASSVTVSACRSPYPCPGQAELYCSMEEIETRHYFCAFNTSPEPIGSHQFYIVANDSQNLTTSFGLDSNIRVTTFDVDPVYPQPADFQSFVAIRANYTENYSYPIEDASCSVSGDVAGTMTFDGNQYVAAVSPARLEDNDFSVSCSKNTYPTRSFSGSFIARDLQVNLGFRFDPLAVGQSNVLYAYVAVINAYSPVWAAVDEANATIFRNSAPVFSGPFLWDSTNGRWEFHFTPDSEGDYTARAYFRNASLNGEASVDMAAGNGVLLTKDSADTISIDLGSSALVNLLVENRRKEDMVYNVTLLGDLLPASFDGEALASRRHSTFAFVPAGMVQSHPLLIRGLETSPNGKEIRIRFREASPPYDSAETSVSYVTRTSRDDRKFAPELDAISLAALALLGGAVIRPRPVRRQRPDIAATSTQGWQYPPEKHK